MSKIHALRGLSYGTVGRDEACKVVSISETIVIIMKLMNRRIIVLYLLIQFPWEEMMGNAHFGVIGYDVMKISANVLSIVYCM